MRLTRFFAVGVISFAASPFLIGTQQIPSFMIAPLVVIPPANAILFYFTTGKWMRAFAISAAISAAIFLTLHTTVTVLMQLEIGSMGIVLVPASFFPAAILFLAGKDLMRAVSAPYISASLSMFLFFLIFFLLIPPPELRVEVVNMDGVGYNMTLTIEKDGEMVLRKSFILEGNSSKGFRIGEEGRYTVTIEYDGEKYVRKTKVTKGFLKVIRITVKNGKAGIGIMVT